MNESDNWNREGDFPPPPSPDEAVASGSSQQHHWPPGYGMPRPYPEQLPRGRRKKRWVAGLLAFLIPGIGHMYLGLMGKAIVLMMLIALDITAIVQVSEIGNTLPVVMLSLLLPIIYFYNLFDAIQSTDSINDRNQAKAYGYHPGWGPAPAPMQATSEEQKNWDQAAPAQPRNPETTRNSLPPIGIMILAGAGVLILLMSGSGWTNWLFESAGSVLGAVVLVGAGIGLWFWEARGQRHKRN